MKKIEPVGLLSFIGTICWLLFGLPLILTAHLGEPSYDLYRYLILSPLFMILILSCVSLFRIERNNDHYVGRAYSAMVLIIIFVILYFYYLLDNFFQCI